MRRLYALEGIVEFGEYCKMPPFVQAEIDSSADEVIRQKEDIADRARVNDTIANVRKSYGG